MQPCRIFCKIRINIDIIDLLYELLIAGDLAASLTCLTKSLVDACYSTRASRRTYQVSNKPNWLRQFQRELINFCKLSRNNIELREEYVRYRRLYCQILSYFRKTSLRKAEGIIPEKAGKTSCLLTHRNCSNKPGIPISNWAQHLFEVLSQASGSLS
ncbi:hypothetical protein GJ496_002063 [Pomphorhynchus laevis]|nr:hypothetical protein GJ496_002063 [Pomphorhynchus laevis]